MRIILIHNPKAGTGAHGEKRLVRLLEKLGDVTYRSVRSKRWKRVFEEERADLIVAAGGDGTVRKVALSAPRGSLLGIIPLGTANNVASSLGVSGNAKQIVASWRTAREVPMDLGLACGPWGEERFLEGLGVGAVTQTAARMDAETRESATAPKPAGTESAIRRARKQLRETLANGSSSWFDLTVDDQSITDEAALLEIANVRYIGPRLAIAPHAHPGDGELDIIWIPEDGRRALQEWLKDASDEDRDPPVRSCRGRRIQIHHVRGQVRVDDRYWPPEPDPEHDEVAADIEIRVDPRSLTILVPESDESPSA